MFNDRLEAGRVLASELSDYEDSPDGVILGLPRGGVVVALAIQQALHLPLDVFITRKLRAPENPEFALGALTETGYRFINPDVRGLVSDSWGEAYLNKEAEYQRLEIEQRKLLYRNGADLPELGGRTVLIVDDGVATGSTVIAAVRSVRELGPARLIVAVPVGSRQGVDALHREADEVIAVNIPPRFRAVGDHYLHFPQVTDDEVVACLNAALTR